MGWAKDETQVGMFEVLKNKVECVKRHTWEEDTLYEAFILEGNKFETKWALKMLVL